MPSSKITLLVLASTPTLALAQSGPFDGPSGALPLGLSLADPLSGTYDATHVKPAAGLGEVVVLEDPAYAEVPDYTLKGLLPAYWDVAKVDAQSSGNATIHDTRIGSFPPAPDLGGNAAWMETVISVDNGSLGAPGSLIADRVENKSGRSTPGADLFGYFQEDSVGVASALPGRHLLEVSAERMGLNGTEEIDGFDFGIGVFSLDPEHEPDMFFRVTDRFFFSLSPDCIQAVNARAQALSQDFAGGVADPATVYVVQRVGTTWLAPQVYISAQELGLNPSIDNLDALEVDPVRENLVFSTQPAPSRSQLRYLDYDSQAQPPVQALGDLGDGFSGLASEGLGTNDETDDIDAVCIIDPRLTLQSFRKAQAPAGPIPVSLVPTPATGTGGPVYSGGSNTLGVPVDPPGLFLAGGAGIPLGISAVRVTSGGGSEVHVQVSGFGGLPPSAGTLLLNVQAQAATGGIAATATTSASIPFARSASEFLVDWSFPVDTSGGPIELECSSQFTSSVYPGVVSSWTTMLTVE